MELTLTKMCQGGIYDHLGGGFARYSTVDERWLVPHFEKMLYDNAQLIECLTWAWQRPAIRSTRPGCARPSSWVLREMIADSDGSRRRPAGAFAATLDADSEGEEGKFYVWQRNRDRRRLWARTPPFQGGSTTSPPEGNWEGKTILNRLRPSRLLGDAETGGRPGRCCASILLAARAGQAIWPGWDDKVLADWNGLMIAALAKAGAGVRRA